MGFLTITRGASGSLVMHYFLTATSTGCWPLRLKATSSKRAGGEETYRSPTPTTSVYDA